MDRSAERTLDLAGLRLPLVDTVIVAVTSLVLIVDFYHDALASADPLLGVAVDRAVLFGVIPMALLLVMGRPLGEHGLRIGSWRVGLAVAGGFALLVTPVLLAVAQLPDFRSYYRVEGLDLPRLLAAHTLELGAAEFLFRGFLMMALVRRCGPIGVLLATVPFTLVHLTKPELEVISTVAGGMAFGWLAWRTGSILYGAALHVYVLTMIVWLTSL
jgi:membrane protease YdiL (CAAX protease family)